MIVVLLSLALILYVLSLPTYPRRHGVRPPHPNAKPGVSPTSSTTTQV